jgi:hypothetical protein
MVRMERVELSRSDEHSVLSAVRLPFRHIRKKNEGDVPVYWEPPIIPVWLGVPWD